MMAICMLVLLFGHYLKWNLQRLFMAALTIVAHSAALGNEREEAVWGQAESGFWEKPDSGTDSSQRRELNFWQA